MSDETADINRQITINAPINKVWDAITDPTQISQWFGESAEFELTAGSTGWFGWENHGQFAVRIEAFKQPNYFAWRWMAKEGVDFKPDESTLVEWHLKAITVNTTEVCLTESGFLSAQSRSDNVGGWQEELDHLIQYLN